MSAHHKVFIAFFCTALGGTSGCALTQPIAPEATRACFPGAIYRKAVSSKDNWRGIEGTVTLPRLALDSTRPHPSRAGRLADNASVYLGGWAPVVDDPDGQELDVGLSWEVVRTPDGRISPTPQAFRPFWRVKQWANAPARAEYYYYPDDTVSLRIAVTADEEIEFTVRLIARGEAARALGAVAAVPMPFQTRFAARGFKLDGIQEFKRVNAIDQAGNEGRAVAATLSKVTGAHWHEVFLLTAASRLAFTRERYTDMRCPNRDQIRVAAKGASGEAIDLVGAGVEVRHTE